jgi:hypothetical protein
MKKFLVLVIGLIVLATFGSPVVAQDVVKPDIVQVDQATPTPDFSMYSFAALVALIPFVVEAFKRLFRLKNSKVIQVVSWITGLGVTALIWAFDVGFVSGLPWYQMLIVGLFASLAANGVYDIGLYTYILKAMGIKTEVNEPPNQAPKTASKSSERPKSVDRKL